MRRLFATLVVLTTLVLAAPPAHAAPRPDVSFRLVGMAPWLTPEKTDLGLHVVATNAGPGSAGDLSFGLTVFTPSRSRNQYEESLRSDPSDAGDLYANFVKVPGVLRPGQSMDLELKRRILRDIAATVLAGNETAVYPTDIELRSGDRTLASIRTPIVFLNFSKRQVVATTRLRLGWTFEFHHDIDYGTDGVYRDTSLQGAVAPHGRLAQEVAALDVAANDPNHPRPVDIVWSPTLISQLEDMRDGYSVRTSKGVVEVKAGTGGAADAAAVLDGMRRLAAAPLVESTALPYAVPNIPALLSAGLGVDLPVQLAKGQEAVGAFTGREVSSDIFSPPGGDIDQATVATLAARGVRTLLLTPSMVHRAPQPKEFAQPATTALTSSLTGTVTGIVPDGAVENLLASPIPARDPRLAAQDVLGELAQTWLEQPGIPRAVAMSFPASLDVPGSLFGPLLEVVGRAPFLQVQKASALVKNFHPDPDAPARLFPNYGQFFSTGYADQIATARDDIALYNSILVNPSPVPARLENDVLLSEGASFTQNPEAGMALLAGIHERLTGLFRGIRPDTSRSVTLASGQGVVPIGITNSTPNLVRVQIRIVSARLQPEAKTETILLRGNSTKLLPFRVRSRTTGRFPVQISVLTPEGRELGPPGELVVRSTSYNLVALILVMGAALFLLVWWARRLLPGRNRPPRAPSTSLPPQAKPA